MNPFRGFAELALELRKEVLHRYATSNPYTREEAAEIAARLRALAADCRVAARRMGCAEGETAADALLHAVVELFNAPALECDPYSRANDPAAAVPPLARLVDDFDAEARRGGIAQATDSLPGASTKTAGASGAGGREAAGKDDPSPGQCSRRRTGRPRKGESDKERLVISALVRHHKWQPGGSVGDHAPGSTKRLAELASGKHVKVSVATVSRFLKKQFPDRGYKGYEAACRREIIGPLLALWQGEAPQHLANLLPQESGRGDDD